MSRAFLPVEYDKSDWTAIQAIRDLAAGKATEDQQRAAWAFIVQRIAAADDLSFRPDEAGGERDTAFHEGRRFVGLQMRKLTSLPANVVFQEVTGGGTRNRRRG